MFKILKNLKKHVFITENKNGNNFFSQLWSAPYTSVLLATLQTLLVSCYAFCSWDFMIVLFIVSAMFVSFNH